MKDLNKLTVAALKELLSARGLSSIGTKTELISRIMEVDPSGACLDDRREDDENVGDSLQGAGTSNTQPTVSLQQRKINLYRRERELLERELALTRLEIEAMRRGVYTESVAEDEDRQQPTHSIAAANNNVLTGQPRANIIRQ